MNEKMEMTREQILAEKEMMQKEYEAKIRHLEYKVERLLGEIEGLKFAMRCNGVSGGDVG